MAKRRQQPKQRYESPAERRARLGIPRGHCTWCRSPVVAPRVFWCSQECVDTRFNEATGKGIKEQVLARDRGICELCGADTVAIGLPWEADHIVPFAISGSHDLTNMRTLCVPCHVAETKRFLREKKLFVARRPCVQPGTEP